MTIAHLPTQARVLTDQQLGFVTEAEGFIFLSAFLAGRIARRTVENAGFPTVARQLWTRALRLYGYHLFLLGIAFTVIATVAVHTKQPSLEGLLDFYLAQPVVAMCSAVLLVYCPPLLDILPMYIIFLLATPIALYVGRRWNWKVVLIPSGVIWILAQLGLRAAIHAHMVRLTSVDVPLNEMGAFNLLAWQFLWIIGLWVGIGAPEGMGKVLTSKPGVTLAVILAATFFLLRHPILHGELNNALWSGLLDKWHLGGLRLLNFVSFAVIFTASRSWVARWLTISPLVSLGKASLEVFCVHLLFCFAALSLVGDGTDVPAWVQSALIAITLAGLFVVSRLFAKPQNNGFKKEPREVLVPDTARCRRINASS